MKEFIITYHFVSGKSVDVKYSEEKFADFLQKLSLGWQTCFSTGKEFGINFSLVTHYEVK